MSKKCSLLINTKDVLMLLTPLAVLVGDREAIALQQIHYWLDRNEEDEKTDTHFFEDKWWAYNTWKGWQSKNFPFWSVATIQRVFESLVNKGLVILRDHANRNKGKWVTICYEALEVFKAAKKEHKRRESKRVRSSQTDKTLDGARSSQTDETGLVKLTRPSSQTDETTGTTETTQETITETNFVVSDDTTPSKSQNDDVVMEPEKKQRRRRSEKKDTVPKPQFNAMCDAFVAAFEYADNVWLTPKAKEIRAAAKLMCLAQYQPEHVRPVHAYCKQHFPRFSPGAIPKYAPDVIKHTITPMPAAANGHTPDDAPLASAEELAAARAQYDEIMRKTGKHNGTRQQPEGQNHDVA